MGSLWEDESSLFGPVRMSLPSSGVRGHCWRPRSRREWAAELRSVEMPKKVESCLHPFTLITSALEAWSCFHVSAPFGAIMTPEGNF